jgi:hypothetical protein
VTSAAMVGCGMAMVVVLEGGQRPTTKPAAFTQGAEDGDRGEPPAGPAGRRPALDTIVKTISTTWRTIA